MDEKLLIKNARAIVTCDAEDRVYLSLIQI